MADNMPTLRNDLAQVARKARLTSAVQDVDSVLTRLIEAREQIAAAGQDPHAASLILTKLQNPVKEGFDKVNDDLKATSKTHKEFGRALDRSFPITPLPTEHDVMEKHTALINRAVATHLLREGQFKVARVFMDEVRDVAGVEIEIEKDVDMLLSVANPSSNTDLGSRKVANLAPSESEYLQVRFQQMYRILREIKAHHLSSAINWARTNSAQLELRGSNLEFELCKLQFIWLTRPHSHRTQDEDDYDDDSSDGEEDPTDAWRSSSILAEHFKNLEHSARNDHKNGYEDGYKNGHKNGQHPRLSPTPATTRNLGPALEYAQANFYRFSERHVAEIQRLAAALVFASNIKESPYESAFETADAFDDVAAVFTREFCSMLGLSAESPLYVAATAGIIALPRLIKFIGATRSKRTAWTTADEMAFETPLPASMMYHPIFVCPVSKEQTTEANPPMRLTCGHVLAKESLRKMVKGIKYKCPYCPAEGLHKDAQQIYL